MATKLDKIIYDLKCSGRLDKAEQSGRMQYRNYRIYFSSNAWHIIPPGSDLCLGCETTLREAIYAVEHDIENFNS